jgi:hypothetical protein
MTIDNYSSRKGLLIQRSKSKKKVPKCPKNVANNESEAIAQSVPEFI